MLRGIESKSILLSFFFLALIWNVNGQSYQDLYTLYQNLFSSYSTYMRPLVNQANVMTLHPSFELITLVELDAIKQQVTINGLLGLSWKDELLTWDPSTYNGIRYIAPDSTLIWKPRLVLLNTMTDRDLFEDDYAPINVDHDGTVTWFPGGLFPITCLLDLRKFPFDDQHCAIRLTPMYMNASDVTFDMTNAYVSTSLFFPHGEWDVTESDISTVVFTPGNNINYVRLDIDFKLSRKPVFFIFNVYFPVVFLCAINVMTFLIPVDEGEKIGFSITVLLSMAVYMGIVSDSLPSNSENMPYMTHYIFLLFGLSVVCCVVTIFIVWLHNKEEKEEKKQKRQLQLKNVTGRLKFFNNLKQFGNSTEKSKIFPHASRKGDTPLDEIPSANLGDEKFPSATPPVSANNSDLSQLQIQDQLKILSAKARLPVPEVSTAGKGSRGKVCPDVKRNRYKNMAQKINRYSAIVFCFISVTVTLIHLILMVS